MTIKQFLAALKALPRTYRITTFCGVRVNHPHGFGVVFTSPQACPISAVATHRERRRLGSKGVSYDTGHYTDAAKRLRLSVEDRNSIVEAADDTTLTTTLSRALCRIAHERAK